MINIEFLDLIRKIKQENSITQEDLRENIYNQKDPKNYFPYTQRNLIIVINSCETIIIAADFINGQILENIKVSSSHLELLLNTLNFIIEDEKKKHNDVEFLEKSFIEIKKLL